ncbi:hypothetical protein TRVA0_017S01926 [Trichomonascus vanleenenianus]|uniref:isoleucine--tRNA ligase ISM1 n=1 Tax=Trichomonascus vanleenenianus TaxID=2268995 RepID=UPI003EC9FF00
MLRSRLVCVAGRVRYSTDIYKKYGETLALPSTPYNTKPPSAAEASHLIDRTGEQLYRWQSASLPKEKTVVFHDGPPYANGALHTGHAMNKVLKDIVNRYNVVRGNRVEYRPGWDCHGLPIEMETMKKVKRADLEKLSMEKRRAMCRETALRMASNQLKEFKGFGVMADWGHIYQTLTPDYVVRQLEVFKRMMEKGLINRKNRPVYWSVESGTALAESELEYGEKTSTAITLKYKLRHGGQVDAIRRKAGLTENQELYIAIWTTTPWTLPANLAIAVHEDIEYAVVRTDAHGHVIVAVNRAAEVAKNSDGTPGEIVTTLLGSDLVGSKYTSLLTKDESQEFPILSGTHVTSASGTGLVHSAPGHGMEDYLMCQTAGIETFSPVNDRGQYTQQVHPAFGELVGQDARKEGQLGVIAMAQRNNAVMELDDKYVHSVPFDWRSKTPVLVRSTPQFFANISSIKEKALASLDEVEFVPKIGKNRLEAFTKSRTEWCISRQRVWGVPIPALFHRETGELLMNSETVDHIIGVIAQSKDDGLSRWFRLEEDISDWLPEKYKPEASNYVKSYETMDVWFDSGSSWTMLADPPLRPDATHLADYYLEGSDQHRGWFQSSLLTKIASSEDTKAPFKRVITHGFVLDQHGRKMSKSLKNVVLPSDIMNEPKNAKGKDKLGVDGLRLWLAQADFTADVSLTPTSLVQLAAALKKVRLTFKFLLGNMSGYDGAPVAYSDLYSPTDRKALHDLYVVESQIREAYDSFQFNRVVQYLQNHMNSNLSALYFDIVKDRVYADKADGLSRRSVQYVFSQIMSVYLAILSPLTPLLTQQVWDHSPRYITGASTTPAEAGWPVLPEEWKNTIVDSEFNTVSAIRDSVLLAMEAGRTAKNVRSSLSSTVHIETSNGDVLALLESYKDHLPAIFITSHVDINDKDIVNGQHAWRYTEKCEDLGVTVTVLPPRADKCPRCWQFTAPEPESLCQRCDDVLRA